MTTSKGGTSTERYSDLATNHDDFLNQMSSSQCLDVRGDADIGGTFYVGGSSGISITVGSGAPSATARKGSIYINYDGTTTNDRIYINTSGSTTWTYITCGG